MTLVPIQSGSETRKRRNDQSGGNSRTPRALRSVGYALLLLSLLDWIVLLVPFQAMNPAWEFQTMGALVERSAVPLIALALVFVGETQQRYRWELPLVKGVSWLSFLLGLLFLLMLPLGLVNTNRLDEQADTQLSTVSQQRLEQLQTFETQISDSDDATILNFLQQQGFDTEEVTPEQVRDQATTELEKFRQQIYTQVETEKTKRWRSLLKNSVKWNVGAVISGFAFLYLWRLSRWARSSRRSH